MTGNHVLDLLRRNKHLVASIKPSGSNRRAWLGIYPLDLTRKEDRRFLRNSGVTHFDRSKPVYHVRVFEVDDILVEAGVSIAEGELMNERSYFPRGEEALIRQLLDVGVQVEDLVFPANSDYPI